MYDSIKLEESMLKKAVNYTVPEPEAKKCEFFDRRFYMSVSNTTLGRTKFSTTWVHEKLHVLEVL